MPPVVKALIVLVLGIVLLGGAGFGGWTLYNKYYVQHDETPKKVEPPPKPPTGFVRLAPLVVPAIGANRVEQFVTVVVTVEVLLEKQPMAQANMTRLTDAFLTAMYGGVADKTVLNGGLINIPAVKDKLVEAGNKVLGAGVVQNVLVQAVTQRNL
ncbi:hypothetical protein [Azospirillum doebereinerae]|uniref:Flagellar basal body-associated FliL family protein n=1 Tax=Azospirillum doebereinerae TaxID=92933 RepID=A0A433JEP0_9PROT|nr:hypothetical protein [Azospirillum doebereinerae]MCG5239166.1 hypothetical protein [Azospirillum doebereinerae]RUQ75642.1 hypothetical protein EJ913_00535 [Azospirillum doebereinerae]